MTISVIIARMGALTKQQCTQTMFNTSQLEQIKQLEGQEPTIINVEVNIQAEVSGIGWGLSAIAAMYFTSILIKMLTRNKW